MIGIALLSCEPKGSALLSWDPKGAVRIGGASRVPCGPGRESDECVGVCVEDSLSGMSKAIGGLMERVLTGSVVDTER